MFRQSVVSEVRGVCVLGVAMLVAGCSDNPPAPPQVPQVPGGAPLSQPVSQQQEGPLSAASRTAPDWVLSANDEGHLLPTYVAVGGYKLRLPNGFVAEAAPKGLMGTTDNSLEERIKMVMLRPIDRTRDASLTIVVSQRLPFGDTTLDGIALREKQGASERKTDVVTTEQQVGKIAGIPYVRFGWTGTSAFGGEKIQGLVYVAFDGEWELQLKCEARQNDGAAIQACEAAILSFLRQ